jgi:hypothetical protein
VTVKKCNKSGRFKSSTRDKSARAVRIASPVDFVSPTCPGESNCPCCRRRSGNRASWQLYVTVIAVTSAVKAVGGAVTGAVTAVTRGRDPCASRDLCLP